MGTEKGEVLARSAHSDPVHAHHPRTRLARVSQDPGVRRAVPLVRRPAIPARLLEPRLVGAFEDEVFEARLPVAAIPAPHLLDRRRSPIVAGRILEPTSLLEQRQSFLQLPSDALSP